MVGTGDINSSIREQEIENDNSVLLNPVLAVLRFQIRTSLYGIGPIS